MSLTDACSQYASGSGEPSSTPRGAAAHIAGLAWMMIAAATAFLGLSATLAQAQLSSTDIEYLEQEGEAEGWTFEVSRNPATYRSIEDLCELQPPPNWQAERPVGPLLPIPDNVQLSLPAVYDWRTQSGTTAVRNQGSCGSCWAFATVAVMESALLIKDGLTTNLSEQFLVSCNRNSWSCNGGWFAHAYHHNTTGTDGGGVGAVLEAAKPYTGTNAVCGGALSHPYVVNNWYYVDSINAVPSTNAIKQAILTYGPVSVAVYVNNAFQAYSSGVFNGCANSTVNHAVVLVGWSDTDQAWIMRNSWGTSWGEGGYMRIQYGCSQIGYGACYVDYGSASDENPAAVITSPAPASTLSSNSVDFQWGAVDDATEYWLGVGNAAGKSNLYSKSQETHTSVTVENLPANGLPLYVRLFTKIDGKWYGRSYTYTAATLPALSAQMLSPANGSTFDSSTVTFEWSTGARIAEYAMWIGTTRGGFNLYKKSQGLNRSATVSNLPAGGRPLYLRLHSKNGAVWRYNDYTYTSAVNPPEAAALTSPQDGDTLEGSTVTFNWSEGLGVGEYTLQIGTSAGAKDIYKKSQGRARSVTLAGLPTNGATLHVRMWSNCAGVWKYNDYQLTAANLTAGAAEITDPSGGTTLDSSIATFTWSAGVGATEYRLNIGTAVGKTDLYNQSQGLNTFATINGLPFDGRTLYVRLWSRIANVWQKQDYTYTSATLSATSADITSPAPGSTLSSSMVTFEWSAGVGATEYRLTIGKSVGASTLYAASTGLRQSVTVTNLPTDGSTLHVRLLSKISGQWRSRDYTYRAASRTARTVDGNGQ